MARNSIHLQNFDSYAVKAPTQARPRTNLPMALLLSLAVVVGLLVSAFTYLFAAARLLDAIENDHPVIWREDLKSPKRIWVSSGGGGRNIATIQPVLPFLRWLLFGEHKALSNRAKKYYRQSRWLMAVTISLLMVHFLIS